MTRNKVKFYADFYTHTRIHRIKKWLSFFLVKLCNVLLKVYCPDWILICYVLCSECRKVKYYRLLPLSIFFPTMKISYVKFKVMYGLTQNGLTQYVGTNRQWTNTICMDWHNVCSHICIYCLLYCMCTHTHTHTHTYIYTYIHCHSYI